MTAGAPPPSAPSAPSARDRDPGLQPERTRLAWRRTTLSCTVVLVLAVRQVVRAGATAAGLTALAVGLLVWLGFLWVARRRMTELSAARPRVLGTGGAVALVVCTLLLAVCAAAVTG
ncbi:DUF202 domain-containing protein [Streptomyces sp. NPDC093109]|uniref:DUF202 domain-containing protein n=1 Tax=Streptomyces sp. NPDC093109 TaxID=3154977 RepID=UPI00344C2DD5